MIHSYYYHNIHIIMSSLVIPYNMHTLSITRHDVANRRAPYNVFEIVLATAARYVYFKTNALGYDRLT